jgi:hypothetical protein
MLRLCLAHRLHQSVGSNHNYELAMKTIIQFSFVLALLSFMSCNPFKTKESISPIIDTDLPSTGSVGEKISFKIQHVVFNGCGKYSRHETTRDGKVITVKFYGKYPEAKICPDNIPTLETYYTFEIKEKGDHYFRFYQNDFAGNEYILDTLRVQ